MDGRGAAGVSGVVLAAGKSTRMGSLKQLLRLEGRPLLEIALENLRASHASEIVVVLGHAADKIQREARLEGVRIAVNEAYAEGMGTSLGVGLRALDPAAQAALIVLADQPFVQAATIDRSAGPAAGCERVRPAA